MIRVLSLIHYPNFGGPHNRNMRLAPLLAERGVQLIVAIPDEAGDAGQRLTQGGIDFITLPLHRVRESLDLRTQFNFWSSLPQDVEVLRRTIRGLDIDVVQLNGFVNPHGAIAGRLEGVAVIWQLLDTRTPNIVRRLLMPYALSAADVIMSDGPEVARVHPGTDRLGARLVPFFPPVDTAEFRPDAHRRRAARLAMNISDREIAIGSVANLNPMKGHELLITALASLRKDGHNVRCCILGSRSTAHDEYAESLIELANEHGLLADRTLRFLNPGERVSELLPAFDVFVRTSVPRSEGTSTSILEAMSVGLPVVSTEVGGIKDAVQNEVSGLLVPPLDAEAVRDAILRLILDPALRIRLSDEARRVALDRYDIKFCVDRHIHAYEVALGHARVREAAHRFDPLPHQDGGQRYAHAIPVVCPTCRGGLDADNAFICRNCEAHYPIIDGIPVMLPKSAGSTAGELTDHKGLQASFFDDAVDEEFEITRPYGAPAYYQWLLGEKFRRSVDGIETSLVGGKVLVVCGGSGMDAHFLCNAGAEVVVCDISLGAMRRAKERAKRFGLEFKCIVADIENLPFENEVFDLVYVHDGLHHLQDPPLGMREMARVARRHVSITEPAKAITTRVAVWLGIAVNEEEAGNKVVRLSVGEITAALTDEGIHPLRSERYLMYYPHQPASLFQYLSSRSAFHLAVGGWILLNVLAKRGGNKLTFIGTRT